MFNSNKKLISNLLNIEQSYMLSFDYFKVASCNIDVDMRATLLAWMLEVCEEEEECTNEIFSLAVNLFDRFMSFSYSRIDKTHLQLIGITCLLIASKLKSMSLDTIQLIEYTAHTFTLEELLTMEMCIMDTLKWDVLAVCPNDFLAVFLDANELVLSQEEMKLLHKHSHAFTALCSIDFSFAFYSPSMIASACLLVALNGIVKQSTTSHLNKLAQVTQIDVDFLCHVTQQVKALFKSEYTSLSHQSVEELEVNMEDESSLSFEQTQFNSTCSSLTEQSFINDDIIDQTFNVKGLSSSSPQFKPKNNNNKFSSRLSLSRRQSMRRSGRARG
jgi:hypothetical protein